MLHSAYDGVFGYSIVCYSMVCYKNVHAAQALENSGTHVDQTLREHANGENFTMIRHRKVKQYSLRSMIIQS